MNHQRDYILGQSERAARRLEIQDAHFGDVSEQLLDDLAIRPGDRVVELGCGPGSFSRRILRRLGRGGVLVAVDRTRGLLDQAEQALRGTSEAEYRPTLADVADLGAWIDGADVVVGRAVLHHLPMAEFVLGRLRNRVASGTRVGFVEPDFRSPLARLARLHQQRPELECLMQWSIAINRLYLANQISPAVGATLARTFELAGFLDVRSGWSECRSDSRMIENMDMFFEEVRDRLAELGILSAEDVDRQRQALRTLDPQSLPAAWATFRVAARVP